MTAVTTKKAGQAPVFTLEGSSIVTNALPSQVMKNQLEAKNMSKNELKNLECPHCGGQLQVSPDGTSAECRFCGSTQLIQQPNAQFDRLCDLPNATFSIRHRKPRMNLEEAKAKIIDEIRRDPIGFRSPENLEMTVQGGFLPVWFVNATSQCSWYGKYSEERTVTNYRTFGASSFPG